MKKKIYSTPQMTVVEMRHQSPLLGYSGAANAIGFDFEEVGTGGTDGMSIDLGDMVDLGDLSEYHADN
jgi:hypothetical protein